MRALVVLVLLASPVVAQKEFGFDNRKGSGQPYLKPEETVAKFKVAPEFEVKLFAGEPLMTNPIAFTLDEKGRTWVVESFEYPKRTPKGKMPRDRIVILEDTDGDGKADKRTVFAEGKDFPESFDMASGIEVGHGGVYLGAPPFLWFIENKNDKPGKFEILAKGFGSQDTHETLNTFQWGPDGWLYGLHGVFTQSNVKTADGAEVKMNAAVWRLHPKTKKFEIFSEGTSNPWGMDWRNTDGQFILACCVIPHLYHMVPGGIYQRQGGASYNPYHYGYLKEISDHTFHRESGWAHAGLVSLDVPHMPERFRNSVIFGSIHGCSIKQNILKPNGSSYIASRGDDFLVSGDKNFRPINMKWGPLGDIYLIDWHDQNPCHQTKPDDWDYERGRVYRIQLKGTTAKKAEDLGKKTTVELLSQLVSGNPYYQRMALRILSERPREKAPFDTFDATMLLGKLVEINDPRMLWAVFAAYPLDDRVVERFDADSPKVTPGLPNQLVSRLRFLSDSGLSSQKLLDEFKKVANSTQHAVVRRELASTAIRLSGKHDVTPLVRALMSRKEDANDPLIPHLTWLAYEKALMKTSAKAGGRDANGKPVAGTSSLDAELAWLAEQAPNNIFVRDQIIPKVMRRLVATGKAEDLERCLKFVGDVTDTNTREKALDGLAIALAGQTVKPPESWRKLQNDLRKEPRLTTLTNKIAVSFRDPQVFQRMLAQMTNAKQKEEVRIEAIRQVAQYADPKSVDGLLALVKEEKSDALRVEAVRALGGINNKDVAIGLVSNWEKLSPPV
ncbi:MAG: HEAT repeat domain-containing protein, partial [Planctomycetia bacterium]|nr:HEAT repeat domain-containing protein [Planctomycetia bacterium]